VTAPSADLPIDPSIAPVSLSKPSAAAAEALEICQVLDLHGVQKVAGMGRIEDARDAVHYAALTGREPEIMGDDPAWVITFKGELPMPEHGAEVFRIPRLVPKGRLEDVKMIRGPSYTIVFGDPGHTRESLWTDATKGSMNLGDFRSTTRPLIRARAAW
jgi:hypothetical protein